MAIARKLLTGVAMSVIALACAGAYADSPPFETHSSVVHIKDLNLNRPQDVATVYQRITVAADRVCGPRSLPGSHYRTTDYENCYTDALARAVARIDQPSVTSYYRQRTESFSAKTTIAQR